MDIPWGSEGSFSFITNVGLITSNGPHGPNIMAAEWTHHISYSPGLILVAIGPSKATAENIRASKEFGVSLASTEQNIISSVAGGSSGRNYDKISALKELGFAFEKAKKIDVYLVKDSVLLAECKLVKEVEIGDHHLYIGEVVHYKVNMEKKPLAYHEGKYWKLTTGIPKPTDEKRAIIKEIVERHAKQN